MVKKKKENSKKKNEKKEKVSEIFEIQKNGKEEIKKVSGTEVIQIETKDQVKKENLILRNVFITLGAIILIILISGFVVYTARHFEYRDMNFNVVKEGKLIFYNIVFPISQNGKHLADYNFYLRNDPRKLNEIPFDGQIKFAPDMVINMTKSFNCDGDGVISIANLVRVYNFAGIKVIKDPNATCDSQGRYMYVNIQEGEETKVEQIGQTCYNINIRDCEILDGTERFIVETFTEINSKLKD